MNPDDRIVAEGGIRELWVRPEHEAAVRDDYPGYLVHVIPDEVDVTTFEDPSLLVLDTRTNRVRTVPRAE